MPALHLATSLAVFCHALIFFPASIRETFFGPFSQLHAIIKD